MYLLPLFLLLGTAVSAASSQQVDDRAERYLLPNDVLPSFYDLILFFDPNNPASFSGEVTITASVASTTNQIVLHAMEMTINEIQVTLVQPTGSGNLYSNYSQAPDDTHLLRIQLTQQLLVGQTISIRITYVGQYAANMFGAYVSTYVQNGQTVSLVTSQLQPTFARRVFPCFDEPALKAIFRTTIYSRPTHTVVRTNMPYRADQLKPNVAGWDKYEFQDTPIMSTYLHGFLVSNFESVTNEQQIFNVTFSVYSRPGTRDSTAFAMEFGQENMVSLVDYYDFLYELPKLDKVAVPDFAAGAMENWGIVIYREVALLVTDGVTTTASKQSVGRLITHENVHLWIGNEVTPISWTYLWLSEGFATFFDHHAIDFIRPSWRMDDQFLLILQNVFQADAVQSVNPMTFPVYTPAEILGTFNAVAYQKSASVIRMLQHILTPEVFQLGVRIYIRAMSRRAAHPSDLYLHFQNAVVQANYSIPYTVSQILEPWVNQGGFPVLTIERSASAGNSVVVSQERYLTARSNSTERWLVAVNWVLSTSPDFSDTSPMQWIVQPLPARAIDIPGLSSAEWFIFNKQQTGYYRVNYDVANWIAIAGALQTNHEVIHVLNRANLLDDAFNLARNGRLNYNVAFNLSRYLIEEKDYIPWGAVNPSFTHLEVALSASDAYPAFQNYLRNLTAPLYQELGFEASATEGHVIAFHRNIILGINCRHGNTDCVNTASQLLEDLKNNRIQSLNPDIQTLVFCSALRGGSEENFNYLWEMYLRSTDSGQQSILLNALGCTSNEERRTFYLNQVIASDSQVREQDRHTIVVSVINSSPESLDAALDFIHENFHLIQPRVQGLTGTTNILNALGRRLTTQAHLTRVRQFVERHSSVFTAGELAAIGGAQENIAASITWTAENEASVEAWLNENFGSGNGAAAITSSLVVLISVILAIFNN
uniref:Aminopeptidase n=1 Tax=Hyphantria cunea TaxID=39466 RepID=A0A2Z3YIN5_HYPCU|nr:aminopeptidase N [Hyphantria cunea]